jgi:hypothetical protein
MSYYFQVDLYLVFLELHAMPLPLNSTISYSTAYVTGWMDMMDSCKMQVINTCQGYIHPSINFLSWMLSLVESSNDKLEI